MIEFVEGHFNVNANCFVQGYWVAGSAPRVWPFETKEEAIEAERQLRINPEWIPS